MWSGHLLCGETLFPFKNIPAHLFWHCWQPELYPAVAFLPVSEWCALPLLPLSGSATYTPQPIHFFSPILSCAMDLLHHLSTGLSYFPLLILMPVCHWTVWNKVQRVDPSPADAEIMCEAETLTHLSTHLFPTILVLGDQFRVMEKASKNSTLFKAMAYALMAALPI